MDALSMSFNWQAALLLPEDVEIIEVNALPPATRIEVEDTGEEYIIHRPGSRENAKAIGAEAARLLEAFRQPRRVVDVVVALSRSTNAPAEQLLDECFPLLDKMVAAGMLTEAGTETSARLAPSLAPGARLGRWNIEACVRLIDDSEIFRARDGTSLAAIKRLRPRGIERGLTPLIAREAEVLRRLDGSVTPTLLEAAMDEPLPWIAIAWHAGVRADRLAADRDFVKICLAVADAYAALHRQGVLHGDVHPGNVLVDDAGQVCLLDFALARIPGDKSLDRIFRGAAPGYWEPEFAAAALRGGGEVPVTAAGEQYAVGTLIDRLLTGEESLRLPAVASRHWHAILNGERRCFAERGRDAWPSVERVLRRAAATEPERRYPDMSAFASELRQAVSRPPAVISPAPDPVSALLDKVTAGGALFQEGLAVAPRSSFNFGAAGIAFALYRIARAREDGELMSVAEVWQQRAETGLEASDGLYDVGDFREEDLGRVSPYHTASGVWLTRALLGRAIGDTPAVDFAIHRYVETIKGSRTEKLDLTLGLSAALLGSAILYEARPAPALRQVGDKLAATIWEKLGAEPPIAEGQTIGYLGIAHGWAGFIYARLAWARVTATPVPHAVLDRLDQLAELADGEGSQLQLPVVVRGHALGQGMVPWMDGWCHGQAGHVFLRLLASRVLADAGQIEAALRLGEAAFTGSEDFGNLCCGLAGRAYSMMALFRASGDRMWLERARLLSSRAASGTVCDRWPNSLYKGRVGLAVIAAELERPELAAMPLFEGEGWLEGR